MILGIGNDIIEVTRIRSSIERIGQRFLDRVFSKAEQMYCQGFQDPAPSYAARFCAKEAASKAFACGIGKDLSFLDLEVLKDRSGQPFISLSEKAKERLPHCQIHLSLSHCKDYATAIVILSQMPVFE